MHFKALVSAIALGAAVSLSGSVSAQEVMINGIVIPEDEMAAVQARCDDLAEAAENESIVSESDDDEAADDGAADDGAADDDAAGDDAADDADAAADDAGDADATIEDAPEVNEMDEATTTVIDLATIDLQACIDAGLVENTAAN